MTPIAVIGLGAVFPDAPDVFTFWENITGGRYSISDVPPDRWDPALYYDPDRKAPDKTYSRIGGWVREFEWDPLGWRLLMPPKVSAALDDTQRWAIGCTRAALADAGHPGRPLDLDRTAVILGNAMGGERHYETSLRLAFPEFARELSLSPTFASLSPDVRAAVVEETHERFGKLLPIVNEDTMPAEIANAIAGRVSNVFNLHGPNYVVDAACASGMAAISATVDGLAREWFNAAVTGGIDHNMGAATYIKFCKVGALSPTGTRPYAAGADGFVMAEGAAVFLLKRLADAERDGDRIYAVILAMQGASDGKGKSITAPNPIGQKLCIERAWRAAGVAPKPGDLIEGHGTSTSVGDRTEMGSTSEVLARLGAPPRSLHLGSVKSNIGHLKGAAGAAGLLKVILALHHKVLPPSLGYDRPNPEVDWERSPLLVNTRLREWDRPAGGDGVRRAGVSAFGFAGTNFHAVLEEYVPGRHAGEGAARTFAVGAPVPAPAAPPAPLRPAAPAPKPPLRGALVIGDASVAGIRDRLATALGEAESGRVAAPTAPSARDLAAPQRLAIDYADAADLAAKAALAHRALSDGRDATWRALRARGVFRGSGPPPPVAFLYPGQGSQYADMLVLLRRAEPLVDRVLDEVDAALEPVLGAPLSALQRTDGEGGPEAAERFLRNTAVAHPAVLAADAAIERLLGAYGVTADVVAGHSLGEYGALAAAGALSLAATLELVSAIPYAEALDAVAPTGPSSPARLPLAHFDVPEQPGGTEGGGHDSGRMAAVLAPAERIEPILATVPGFVVVANLNSRHSAVIGGETAAVEQAVAALGRAGLECVPLPVTHAFHTRLVEASVPSLRRALVRSRLRPPLRAVVANVTGELYPTDERALPRILDTLAPQFTTPISFVRCVETLWDRGVRAFVEVGPKRAVHGFVADVLADRDAMVLFTNHPKVGDVASFNQALCGLYALGLGAGDAAAPLAARRNM